MKIGMYPITVEEDGVKIKPENMEKEKLYHCVFKNKVLLFYKDDQDILNCYEIEEEELVEKVKTNPKSCDVEKIFQEYIKGKNLKH